MTSPSARASRTRPYLRPVQSLANQGPDLVGVDLDDFSYQWIDERLTPAGKPLRPRTVELYQDQLRLHILPTFGQLDLAEITTPQIRRWCKKMRASDGPGACTAAKCYRLLKAILQTAADDELLPQNPCRVRGAGKEPTSKREIPTVVELYHLAEVIDDRLRALILSAAFLGLRRAELLGLQRRDIDLKNLEVHVLRSRVQLKSGRRVVGPAKTDQSHRVVTIPRTLGPELRHHLANYAQPGDEGWVFTGAKGGPLGPTWFQNQWTEARHIVGVPDLHFHDLRHLAGTLAALTGATTREVMERLGHATMETAMRYQHATAERNRALADALDDIIVESLPEERRRYVRVNYG